LNNQKYSKIPPLIEEGNTINDSKQKSDIFNKHFANKATVNGPDDNPPTLIKKDVIEPFAVLNTSPIEVAQIIRELKKSNMSYCGVPGKFLSEIATPISFALTKVFNNIFLDGTYPEIWKISHITAIYKRSGLKCDKVNYRPISLLPTLSKVCETIIHKRLLPHLIDNNLITTKQAAYLKGDSTSYQLIHMVHKIRETWTHRKICHGLFLDVKSAFDKVWHKGLLAKLDQIGIEGNVHQLFKSYLHDRKQRVVVDGSMSEIESVKAGIPQGSKLGPMLFIIYINDIDENLQSSLYIFADDTSLFAHGSSPEETTNM
jgi:hypothetical protein